MASRSAFGKFLQSRLWRLEDRMSLRWQVALGTSALVFAIVAVVAFGAARVGQREAERTAGEAMASVASTLADRIDRGIAARFATLELFAKLFPLRDMWTGDQAALRAVLEDARAAIPGAVWIGFAMPDGKVYASTGAMLQGKSVAERPWFVHGLKGTTFEDVHEAKLLAPLLGPAADGQPRRFVDIAFPITSPERNLLGVLGLHIGWEWVNDLRVSTLAGMGASGADLWIVNAAGKVILGPKLGAELFQTGRIADMKAAGRGVFADIIGGEQVVVGYAHASGFGIYRGLGWTVVARQPAAVAFAPAYEIVRAIVVLGLGVGVIGIVGALLIAGRATRPIGILSAAAERMGPRSTEMLPRLRGAREVVRLSTALRGLVLRLGLAERRKEEAEHRAADEARKFSHDIEVLRSLADTDPLTRLHNRRSFMVFADDAMEHYRRYHRAFAVLMIDIDHFKRVNDVHGHAAGDTAIRYVASLAASAIRPSDKAGRFGGEEFVVLLKEVGEAEAVETAERIRKSVAEVPVRFNNSDVPLTVSIGIAVVRDGDQGTDDVILRADLALYAAKGDGRNRVSTRGEPPPARKIA